jgi:signal transduction histidine kinase
MHEERIWTEAVVTGFKLIAHVFAGALGRKRTDEELQRHEQTLSRLTGRIINAQEAELRRLSRELHDDLTQRLAALSLDAALIERQLSPVQPQAVQALRDLRGRLTDIAEDVHNLSRQLHPSILDDLGLVQAVQAECDAFIKKTGIDVSLEPADLPDSISQDLALCLYRIIQEGLQNIGKHAQAVAASITLQGFSGGINLVVRDNGIGFDPAQAKQKAGIGLSSMRERVRLVNGTLNIVSEPGKGSEIQIFIPLEGNA